MLRNQDQAWLPRSKSETKIQIQGFISKLISVNHWRAVWVHDIEKETSTHHAVADRCGARCHGNLRTGPPSEATGIFMLQFHLSLVDGCSQNYLRTSGLPRKLLGKDSEVLVAGHLGTGQNSDCQPGMGKAPTASVPEADSFFPGR